MADFNTKQSNIDQLNRLAEADLDFPIDEEAISGMYELVQMCDEYELPQPEIYPWSGGKGIQAEWDDDWYIEVGSDGNEIYFYASNDDSDMGNVECSFENMASAVQFLRFMFEYIVCQ